MAEHQKIKAIAFDLDHTLYDRYSTLRSIAYLLKQRYRADLNPRFSAAQLGDLLVALDKTYIYAGWPIMFEKLIEKGVFVNPPSFEEYFAFFMEAFQKIAVPFPMADEMLRNLQSQGYKVGLLTNGESVIQRGKVKMIGLLDSFDKILAGGEMGRVQKPDIHPFQKMAECLGCTTAEMIYVGDNPLNDMEAARRAGCIPIWVKASGQDWAFPEYEKPRYEVNDILELPELLKQLEKENTRNRYQFNGILDRSVTFIEEFQLLREELWTRFVQQFKEDADYEGGWRGEYWGKMMRGACFVYEYSRNPELYRILTDTVKDMLSAQEENGRISSYGVNHELEAWDLWCRKYVLLGMQYYLDICEDAVLSAQIVDSMCRQVDYIMERIGDPKEGKRLITKATRHWRGLNSASILEPIVKLYRLTKEQRYLDFAAYIVKSGGTDIVNLFELAYEDQLYPYQYPVTKAYEMISCFEGLLEYYDVTREERYKTSVINFANKILESDFTIIGCCGCTHELFDHSAVRQANTNNGAKMQETCVTVTVMKFFYHLSLLTGDRKYVDAFETSLYNAYLGAINTEKVVEPVLLKEHPDWYMEPLPFDSYSPLTAGTRGNGIGGLKRMSDNHYYGCCACIGAAGLGLVPKMALAATERGYRLNLFVDGTIETFTPNGEKLSFKTETAYPVSGQVQVTLELEQPESFEMQVRVPAWSKRTGLAVNGVSVDVVREGIEENLGYVKLNRSWSSGDQIKLELDMRTECIKPIPYGHQILMNRVIWGANYMIPTYDEEDPAAKAHRVLRRGPVVLAQENRLGYSVDEPVELLVGEDGYVHAAFAKQPIAPYENMMELEVPLADGSKMHVTDYASAGKLWTEESKMAAWILVKNG